MDNQPTYQQSACAASAPAAAPQQGAPSVPVLPDVSHAPATMPAGKPKKGWGRLFAALAFLPLIVVGEIIGLYVGDATVLGEDLGAELFGALFALIPCIILGGTKMINITMDSWKWAWRALWWSIAISAGIAAYDLWATIDAGELILVSDWPWQAFLSVIFCIAIGVFEECMVRGLVLNGLLARMGTKRSGMVWACILSSLFFGLLHVDLSRIGDVTNLELAQGVLKVLQTGMYGFALAAVVCKTGELVSVSLLHGLDDWLLFILTFVMGESLETEYVASGTEEGWATVIVYVICILLYIPLVVRAIKTLRSIEPTRGAFYRSGTAGQPALATAAPAGYAAPMMPVDPAVVAAPAAPVSATMPAVQAVTVAPAAPAAQTAPVSPVARAASVPPVLAAPSVPAAPAAPIYPTAPQGYVAQQLVMPAPYSASAASAPASSVPTQIPEGSLFQTGQSGAQGAQTPQDPQTSR